MGCRIVTAADVRALHVDLLPMIFCPTAFCNAESSFCTLMCLRSILQHVAWLYGYKAITWTAWYADCWSCCQYAAAAHLDTATTSLLFEFMRCSPFYQPLAAGAK